MSKSKRKNNNSQKSNNTSNVKNNGSNSQNVQAAETEQKNISEVTPVIETEEKKVSESVPTVETEQKKVSETVPANESKEIKISEEKSAADKEDETKAESVKEEPKAEEKNIKTADKKDESPKKSNSKSEDEKVSKPEQKSESESNPMFFLRVAGTLTLICALIALMMSVVNGITKDKIAANVLAKKMDAISRIFDGADNPQLYENLTDEQKARGVSEIYLVNKNGAEVGYCANVQSNGFGGAIDMMIGVDSEGNVVGVEIVSMNETPGLGSKTNSESFLGQFKGQSASSIEGNVDAISGATISSKAVTAGVSAALSVKDEINK